VYVDILLHAFFILNDNMSC